MKRYTTVLAMLAACSPANGDGDPSGSASLTAAGTSGIPLTSGVSADDSPDSGPGDASDDGLDDGANTKFDLDDNGDICSGKDAGIYCMATVAVECDGSGGATDTTNCLPGQCVPDEGCVACVDGQFACHGPRVMSCNTGGAAPTWDEIEVCDSAGQMVCDSGLGTCIPLAPIGDIVPTGEYYQYAVFDLTAGGFSQVSDVDSYGNRIYFVAMKDFSTLTIGVYDVELLDSDGDGKLEPNQHPDYIDDQGPVEERVFTFVESFPITDNPGAFPNIMELYATDTTLVYSGPIDVKERVLATGVTTQIAPMPTWITSTSYQWLAFLGYDEINDVWYSGNEAARRVFQYDKASGTWGYAFEFPMLAGDHMDGIEVVVDVTTGTPYVYVSDMTSNFIGQYRHDPDLGWVQHNLFSYVESGAPLEGFGFGALNHFWVGSLGQTFYELGGGDLTEYIDPAG
jgi:hypothetical protein